MIEGYVSLKTVLSTLYRNLGVNTEINEIDVVEWAAEALSMVGAYSQYQEVSVCTDLSKGKAKLPVGFQKLVDVTYKDRQLYWATNTNAKNYQCDNCQVPVCTVNDQQGLTFYLNDNYIITNITDDTVGSEDSTKSLCMVYLSLLLDEDGWPMIPDNIYYSKAITSYITERLDLQEWRKGKLPDKVYQKSEQDWLFYVNSARGAANMPGVAQMENLKNITGRFMPLRNDYSKAFRNIRKKERLNLR